jgi:HAD superfamily hydrolase (TIGR01509 family)
VFKEMFNVDFTRDDFMKYISGRGSREGIIEYLASKGITEFSSQELNDLFYKHKNELVKKKMNSEIYLLPGIKDFLESNIIKKKRKVIITSSRKGHVENILTHFGIYSYFERVIDRFDVVKGKPNPEAYLKGLEYLGCTETECVAFEDSFFGLQSAKGAGIFTIGILNSGWNDDFVYQLSDFVIDDYRVLI